MRSDFLEHLDMISMRSIAEALSNENDMYLFWLFNILQQIIRKNG